MLTKPSEIIWWLLYWKIGGNIEMKIERYTNSKGEAWVRIKFVDANRTEVIMSEEEFVKKYGEID